ncbi:IS200/IS605 family transposase [Litorivivens lipolytica]|uniref:IS200/IS605 family transposase n=1 Tax=Litorivivens lipolytica TaxID=1524264 RepID=UPI00160F7835|nr:IS200/IS605 family transposase [Litorivivens lipolytica]
MYDEAIRKRHSVTLLYAHLVFTTKYRRKVLTGRHIEDISWAFKHVCDKNGCVLEQFDGEQDHVHLLVKYPPRISISWLANQLKATGSRRLRGLHPELQRLSKSSALWSRSYFACSAGGAPIEVLRQYIEQQDTPPG